MNIKFRSHFPLKYFLLLYKLFPSLFCPYLILPHINLFFYKPSPQILRAQLFVIANTVFFNTHCIRFALMEWCIVHIHTNAKEALQNFQCVSFISYSTYPDQLKNAQNHKNQHATEQSCVMHSAFLLAEHKFADLCSKVNDQFSFFSSTFFHLYTPKKVYGRNFK